MKPTSNIKTLQQAQNRLQQVRKDQAQLVIESKQLREFIILHGGDPSPFPDNTKRNESIYKEWKGGQSFRALASKYKLSVTRIGDICKKMDR